MRTITFYGYKGGSGRTLAVAHIARFLAQLGQRVVALDFDLDAPGLPTRLRPTEPQVRGFVDLVEAFRDTGEVTSIERYLLPVEETWRRSDQSETGSIRILPAGGPVGIDYWRKLTGINWQTLFVGSSSDDSLAGRGVPFVLELKEQIEATGTDYLLIDSRTGVTELGGVACTVLADDLVCLCIHNVESLEGTREVLATLRLAQRPPSMKALHILPVLARIPTFAPEKQLVERTMARLALEVGPNVDELVIVHSVPRLEIDDRIRDLRLEFLDRKPEESGSRWLYPMSESYLGEARLFGDYMALFRRLLPAALLDNHLRKLVGEAQVRAFTTPELAQQELQAIAYQYPHEHGFRALLQLYRLRTVFDSSALDAAQRLVAMTRDPAEELVWEVVSRWLDEDDNLDELEPGSVNFCAQVWLAHKEKDGASGSAGLKLLRLLTNTEHPGTAPLIHTIVEALTTGFREDAATGIGLARYFIEHDDGERAIMILQRMNALKFPPSVRMWAHAVVTLGSQERAQELVNHPHYQDDQLRDEPKLWVEVHRLAGRLDDALGQELREVEMIFEAAPRGDLSPRARQRVRQSRDLFVAAGRLDELSRRARTFVSGRHPEQMNLFRLLERGRSGDE